MFKWTNLKRTRGQIKVKKSMKQKWILYKCLINEIERLLHNTKLS